MKETLTVLQQINGLLAQANPLVGSVTALGIALIQSIKANGTAIGPFADEIAKFETILANGVTVDDAWRAANGLPVWKAPNA